MAKYLIGFRFTQVETTFSQNPFVYLNYIVYLSLYVCYMYMHKVYVLTEQAVPIFFLKKSLFDTWHNALYARRVTLFGMIN